MSKLGAVENQPQNVNFLATHRFRLVLQRAPNVVYFCQEVNLPGIAMGNPMQPSPFTDLPVPGEKINFEDLNVTFPVDEDMNNWKEIFNWMTGLGFPQDYAQHKALVESQDGWRSDILLMLLDSNNNPAHTINFQSAFPASLSGIQFDAKANDTAIAMASVVFKYDYFTFEDVVIPASV